MFVAFCDHVDGNSTSSWRNEPTAAVRVSHSTVSNGCTPAWVNRRRTVRASPERGSFVSVVCGVCCSIWKLPFLRGPLAVRRNSVGRRVSRSPRTDRRSLGGRSRNMRKWTSNSTDRGSPGLGPVPASGRAAASRRSRPTRRWRGSSPRAGVAPAREVAAARGEHGGGEQRRAEQGGGEQDGGDREVGVAAGIDDGELRLGGGRRRRGRRRGRRRLDGRDVALAWAAAACCSLRRRGGAAASSSRSGASPESTGGGGAGVRSAPEWAPLGAGVAVGLGVGVGSGSQRALSWSLIAALTAARKSGKSALNSSVIDSSVRLSAFRECSQLSIRPSLRKSAYTRRTTRRLRSFSLRSASSISSGVGVGVGVGVAVGVGACGIGRRRRRLSRVLRPGRAQRPSRPRARSGFR